MKRGTRFLHRHWLNPGDWEWCPDHKDTPRHFECSKTITIEHVITAVDKALGKQETVTEEIIDKKEKKSFFGKFF